MPTTPRKRKATFSTSAPRRSLRLATATTTQQEILAEPARAPAPTPESESEPGIPRTNPDHQHRDVVHNLDKSVPESEPSIEMELVIAPPNRIAAGSKLGSPLVVTFKASKLRRRPVTAEGGEGQDLSGVWAYISLMSEDKSRTLAPPRTDLLRGHPAASIHPLDSAAQRGGSSFAYAAFPDLTITAPGRYCFCINVFDMNRYVSSRSV